MNLILGDSSYDISDAASALINGNLVAFPTETVYGLGASATNSIAVKRIFSVKERPISHPLIVHISSVEMIETWSGTVPEYVFKLAQDFWPGPLTVILNRSEIAGELITGGSKSIGIRVPGHPIAIKLLKKFESLGGLGIAAPSANRFGAVSATAACDVLEEIGHLLSENDRVIDGGRCEIGIESTILDCTGKNPYILRLGAVTETMILKSLNIKKLAKSSSSNQSHPGSLEKHYQPKAKVVLNVQPLEGDGFIAMEGIKTPDGVFRLFSPSNLNLFAKGLYSSFREADKMNLKRIVVIVPEGGDFALAIKERLIKASS